MPEQITVKTMCPMNCHPTLCGMKVTVSGPDQVQIEGDPDNPDSQGFLCMRGNAAHEIVGNPRRLLKPQRRSVRGSTDWADTTWEEALDQLAVKMNEVGREAVAIWPGHGNAVNDYGFGLKRGQLDRFANLYGCQFWNPAMICWGMGGFGLGLTGALETSTKEDMGAHSQLIVLWGANTVSQANTIKHVETAKRRGAHIVVIDVRRTEVSALAHEVILVRPGSDVAFALAMMQVIVSEGLHDADFVAEHTVGFDALREHLADKTPDWAAERTGVEAGRIAEFARRYAATKPAMIVIGGSSLHKGDNTWVAARAISCLPGLTGNFGIPGGGIGPRHGARSHGAGFADISAADRRLQGDYVPNQMEAIVEAMEAGRIKVLMTLGSNFLSSFPDTARVEAALANVELIVAYDIFPNQTIRQVADVVLPGTIWLEEIGAKSTNTHVYLSDQALIPREETKPLYAIFKGLADRLEIADVYPWADQSAAINAVLDHPSTGHATVDQLRENGGRAELRISHVAYPTLEFDTPSGKLEFCSEKALELGVSPLPEAPEVRASGEGLVLAQGRTFAHFHSFYDHARALPSLAKREEAPQIWIAPADAEARDISDGDRIELRAGQAAFVAKAKVTRRMPAGAVWSRDGWPGFNALTDGRAVLPDSALTGFPFSVGQAGFGAVVELVKA